MSEIQSNGTGQSEHTIAESLMDEATAGYVPQLPLEAMWNSGGELPQVTMRRDIEFMSLHPIVMTAMEYYKSGIAGAEFWGGPDQANPDNEEGQPISLDPKVSQFVLAHCERFWQRGLHLMQEGGYAYGWSPGEHIYKESGGMFVWSHMKSFHPIDGHILTLNYQPVGVRVKNVRGKQPVDMHFASDNIPAKGCWYAHRPRYGSLYGRSQYTGGWRPWRRLGWRDALEQVIDAALYRAGYAGPVVRHPTGESAPTSQQGVPATRVDGSGLPRRSNRDVARQIVEWIKAGAGITLSSENYSQAQGGGPKWDVKMPEHVMDVNPLINSARYLEDQIMLGIGVPPELIKAADTGSGYSGRSIPREAFLDGQQKVGDAILQMFVEQVIRPLVLWNFGDVPFNVQCKSLLKSQSEDKQGEDQDQQQGQNGSPQGKQALGNTTDPTSNKQSPNTQPPPSSPQPTAMSIENRNRALDIVRRVLDRRVA